MSSIIATDKPAYECLCTRAPDTARVTCAHTTAYSLEGDDVSLTVDGPVCDEVRLLKDGVVVASAARVHMLAVDEHWGQEETCGGFMHWVRPEEAGALEHLLTACAMRA